MNQIPRLKASTQMKAFTKPDFVGSQWLLAGQGFAYAGCPPDDLAYRIDDANEWIKLLAIFERLKNGTLNYDADLIELVSGSQDRDIRVLGLTILRHVGSSVCRKNIAAFFQHEDVDTRFAAYDAALYSADIRLIEPLLHAHRNTYGDERSVIMHAISHLLETEPDQLYDDTDDLSQDAYEGIALAVAQEIQMKYWEGVAIFEGNLLSLSYILERIKLLCNMEEAVEYSGAISTYIDLFEATTGRSCIGVFDDTVAVRTHEALRLVADFEVTGLVANFTPGCRYFFGHQLPS